MRLATTIEHETRALRLRLIRRVLLHRLIGRYPTLRSDPTALWDYQYDGLDAIELGQDVSVGAYAEIVVYATSPHSRVPGRLIVGDRSVIQAGANIRAAGGTIRIGAATIIAQHTVIVAANHTTRPGEQHLHTPWNEARTGVEIGRNVWVAANCTIGPGARIGDDAVIGAGSFVNCEVPAGTLWPSPQSGPVEDEIQRAYLRGSGRPI